MQTPTSSTRIKVIVQIPDWSLIAVIRDCAGSWYQPSRAPLSCNYCIYLWHTDVWVWKMTRCDTRKGGINRMWVKNRVLKGPPSASFCWDTSKTFTFHAARELFLQFAARSWALRGWQQSQQLKTRQYWPIYCIMVTRVNGRCNQGLLICCRHTISHKIQEAVLST